MKYFVKILSIAVILISIFVLVACVAGVFSAWLFNPVITDKILSLLTPFQGVLFGLSGNVSSVGEGLEQVNGFLAQIPLIDRIPIVNDLLEQMLGLQGSITQTNEQIIELHEALGYAIEHIPGWLDVLSILLSLAFLWIGFSQVSLVSHAVQYYKQGSFK